MWIVYLISLSMIVVFPNTKVSGAVPESLTDDKIKTGIKEISTERLPISGILEVELAKFQQGILNEVRNNNQFRKLFERNLFIRSSLAILTFEEVCDSSVPQLSSDSWHHTRFDEISFEVVGAWQEEILNIGKRLCNFKQRLECIGNTCQCNSSRDLSWDTYLRHCFVAVGQPCSQPILYGFDANEALTTLKGIFVNPLREMQCEKNALCTDLSLEPNYIDYLFFTVDKIEQRCWCIKKEGFTCKYSPFLISDLNRLSKRIHLSTQLKQNESCIPDSLNENILSSASDDEKQDGIMRIKNIKKVIQGGRKFCNVFQKLRCSENSKTCQKFCSREGFNANKCMIKNGFKCSIPNRKQKDTMCIHNAKCRTFSGETVNTKNSYLCTQNQCSCECSNNKIGELCDKPQSRFGNRFKPNIMNVFGQKFLDLESRIHHDLRSLEKLMTLPLNSDCDSVLSQEVEQVINYFGNLDTTTYESLVKLKSMLEFANSITKTGKPLCDYRKMQICSSSSKTCQLLPGIVYEPEYNEFNIARNQPCENYGKDLNISLSLHAFCVRNALCVKSYNTPQEEANGAEALKVCVCKIGMQGKTCNEDMPPDVPRYTENEKTILLSKMEALNNNRIQYSSIGYGEKCIYGNENVFTNLPYFSSPGTDLYDVLLTLEGQIHPHRSELGFEFLCNVSALLECSPMDNKCRCILGAEKDIENRGKIIDCFISAGRLCGNSWKHPSDKNIHVNALILPPRCLNKKCSPNGNMYKSRCSKSDGNSVGDISNILNLIVSMIIVNFHLML